MGHENGGWMNEDQRSSEKEQARVIRDKPYTGPVREKAKTLLQRKIFELEHRIIGLKAMLEMCPEEGEAEQAVWEILQRGLKWIQEV